MLQLWRENEMTLLKKKKKEPLKPFACGFLYGKSLARTLTQPCGWLYFFNQCPAFSRRPTTKLRFITPQFCALLRNFTDSCWVAQWMMQRFINAFYLTHSAIEVGENGKQENCLSSYNTIRSNSTASTNLASSDMFSRQSTFVQSSLQMHLFSFRIKLQPTEFTLKLKPHKWKPNFPGKKQTEQSREQDEEERKPEIWIK